MGFLLYTKTVFIFVFYARTFVCLILTFWQLFVLFALSSEIFTLQKLLFIDGFFPRAIINFINQKDPGLFPSHTIGTS